MIQLVAFTKRPRKRAPAAEESAARRHKPRSRADRPRRGVPLDAWAAWHERQTL